MKLGEFKDLGNAGYKVKNYTLAIQKFSEGITLYNNNFSGEWTCKEIAKILAQLYTNRALSWH